MEKIKNIGFSIGYTSLIMIFVILVFVSFSALSYTQANNDLSRINKAIDVIDENYQADTTAMQVKMAIDEMVVNGFTPEEIENTLKSEVNGIIVNQNSANYIIIISSKAYLNVELGLDFEQKTITVKSWVVENTSTDEYNLKGFDL
ncbi:hypothetical protein [Anaerorhabdus sp.]|uniref:hypothetical protein n=1 Tax=Anaerorhabdus sp. TaxID=1872524 RepID=UPI002B1FFF7F|nr:hypothetical protein [Anaerorhabdus sp.]MEA4874592.1 hypothetical protein [Anaerorhabdus sp.]